MKQACRLMTAFFGSAIWTAGMALSAPMTGESGYWLKYSQLENKRQQAAKERPFHTGLIKLNPLLDQQKPLATADYSGVAYESGILIGAVDEQWVGAFHVQSNKPLWWYEAKGGLTSPPGIFGSWAVLALREGQLVKLNLLTGKKLWEVKLDSFAARSFKKVGSQLLVVTASQSLYSIDFQSGKTRWIYDGGFPEGLTIRNTAAPTVHDNKVYYGLASGEIAAVELESGQLLWRHNPAFSSARFHDIIGELIILDRRLLVSRYDGLITSLSLENPKGPVAGWDEPKEINTITSNAYRHGKLYVGTSNGYVYAFNARTGKEMWRTLIGESISTITAGESQLYTSTSQGRISTLDSSTGGLIWHDDLGSQILTPPIYIEKDLYFFTGHKTLYGYKIK